MPEDQLRLELRVLHGHPRSLLRGRGRFGSRTLLQGQRRHIVREGLRNRLGRGEDVPPVPAPLGGDGEFALIHNFPLFRFRQKLLVHYNAVGFRQNIGFRLRVKKPLEYITQ